MSARIGMFSALAFLIAGTSAHAGKLAVVAGGGTGGDGTSAATAKLTSPFATDFGADGTIYFVEMEKGERCCAIDAKGILHTLVGTGMKGYSGDDGPGAKAMVNGMHHLAVGPQGLVYLADTWNHRIRVYNPKTGNVSAFAGTGEKGFGGDGGPCDAAKFGDVYCLAFDRTQENLYIADLDNRRIRKIDMKTKVVTTAAGNGTKGVPTDGAAAVASPLFDPRAVAVAPDGSIFILERSGHALRKVDPAGKLSTVAGTGTPGSSLGVAGKAQFNSPKHLCIENHGTTYSVLIADSDNHRIVRYSLDGKLELVAGTGKKGSAIVDGEPLKSELSQPHGISVHPKTGEIYIADSGNNRILKIKK